MQDSVGKAQIRFTKIRRSILGAPVIRIICMCIYAYIDINIDLGDLEVYIPPRVWKRSILNPKPLQAEEL